MGVNDNDACTPELMTTKDAIDDKVAGDNSLELLEKCAADAPGSPARHSLWWLLLGISSHLSWGLFPVFSRYLQSARGLDGMLMVSLVFGVPLLVVQLTTCSGFGGVSARRIGCMYSIICFSRTATAILAFKYTLVLYTQLITQLAPFITAIMSRAILHEELPRSFVPALVASTLGAVMCIIGQSSLDGAEFTSRDVEGISIALVSNVFSAGMRIFMKLTNSTLTEEELISWQYTNVVPLGLVAIATMSPSAWSNVESISVSDICVLAAFIVVIGLFATISQVATMRKLGPAMASSLQPVRLVSAIIGGYFALGEKVHSITSWIGVVVIIVTISAYLCAQSQKSSSLGTVNPGPIRLTEYERVA